MTPCDAEGAQASVMLSAPLAAVKLQQQRKSAARSRSESGKAVFGDRPARQGFGGRKIGITRKGSVLRAGGVAGKAPTMHPWVDAGTAGTGSLLNFIPLTFTKETEETKPSPALFQKDTKRHRSACEGLEREIYVCIIAEKGTKAPGENRILFTN